MPTAADDVFFDASSGGGTVTITATANALSFTAGAFTGAFTFNAGLIVVNNVTLPTAAITFGGSFGFTVSGTCTFTSNGCTTTGGMGVTSAGSNVTFADAARILGTVTHSAGTLNTNDKTMTWGAYATGSGTGTGVSLTLGASPISITGGGTSFNLQTTSAITLSAGTSVITMSGNATWRCLPTQTFYALVYTGAGSNLFSTNGTVTLTNLTATGTAVKTDGLRFASIVAVTGTLTLTGNSVTNRLLVSSSALGSVITITAAAVSLTNVDFQDVTAAGAAAPFTGSSLGDALGNASITFTVAVTRFRVAAGNWSDSNWSTTTGGGTGASVPLPQDTVTFDGSSGVGTVTADMPRLGKDLTFTGYTGTAAFSSVANSLYGSLTLASGMTVSGVQVLTLGGRGSHTVTSATKTFTQEVDVISSGGTYTLQDAFATATSFRVNGGTFTANNQTVTLSGALGSTNTVASRILNWGSGTWTNTAINAVNGVNIASTSGLTMNVSTAVLIFTGAPGSATTVTIITSTATMPNFTVNGGANLTVQLSDAFTTAGTITLTQAKLDTNGFAVSGAFSAAGSATATLTLGSTAWTATLAPNPWIVSNNNLTITANTSTVTVTCASTFNIQPGRPNYNNIVVNGAGNSQWFSTFTAANVTITGTAAKTQTHAFGTTSAMTVTGALTLAGNSATNRMLVMSNTLGSAATITLGASATAKTNSSNVDFQDITMTGGAANERDFSAITGLSGDALGNTGITFTTQITCFWVSGTGSWSDSTKWKTTTGGAIAARVPLPQDTARFDGSSFTAGSQTLTLDMPRLGKDLIFTGVTNTPNWSQSLSTGAALYGSYTGATMTRTSSAANSLTFAARSSVTFTTGGMTMPSTTINASGGTVTVQDAYSNGGNTLTVSLGTIDANGQTVSTGTFGSTGSSTRGVTMGSGAWSVTAGTSSWSTASTGLTLTVTGNTTSFTATSGSNTIATGGVTMPNITFNGAGGSWTNSDAFTTAGTITLTAGAWSTGNQSIAATKIVVGAAGNGTTRAATLGSSTVTISGNLSLAWDASSITGLTFTAGTSTITFTGGFPSLVIGALTYNAMTFPFETGVAVSTTGGAPTFASLSIVGTAAKTCAFATGQNLTVTGTLTLTGNSAVNRLFINSGTTGTSRTLTAAAVSLTNVDFQDITGAGAAAPFTGTSLGDALGNSGITFDVAVTRFAVVAGNWSSTATWSATTGGAGGASVPLPQDTVTLDASSAAGTYTVDMPRIGKDITCTGFTRTLAFTVLPNTSFGNWTMGSGMTLTSGSTLITLSGRSSLTVTSAGKTSSGQFAIAAPGGTYTLQDALNVTATISVANGTFAANGFAVTATLLTSSNLNTRAITMGSGAWSLNATSSNCWNTGTTTGLTLTVTGNTTSYTATSGTATVTSGGASMPNWTVNGAGGTCQLSDAFTTAGTITLTSGTLDTNSKAVSCATFSGTGPTTRTLTMGSSTITATTGGTAWSVSTVTNLTVTANTATAVLNTAGANFNSGAVNWNGLTLSMPGSGTRTITATGAFTIAALSCAGTASQTCSTNITGPFTVTGTIAFSSQSVTNAMIVQSSVLGTQRTITNSAGVVTLTSRVDFSDIALSVAVDLSASLSGNALGNGGITFNPAQSNFYKAAALDNFSTTAKWFLATNGGGGAGRVPLPQDTGVFDSSSGAFTYTMDMPRYGSVTATGFTGTLSWSSIATTTFGNLTLGSSTVVAGLLTLTLGGRSTQTITSSGRTWTMAITMNAPSGTYTLQDALADDRGIAGGGVITVTAGTFAGGSQSVSLTAPTSSVAVTGGTLSASGSWSISDTAAGTIWSVTGGTLSTASITISLAGATSNSRTFIGGGKTYGTLSYTVAASTGALVVTGANTFTAVTVTSEAGFAKTLTLPSAVTTTVTTLTLTGASGSLLTLNASTPTSAATISSGGTINAQFLSLTDQATAGASSPFTAYDSSRVTNVSGWSLATRSTFTGSSTPTGSIVRQESRHLAGSSTPTGRVVRSSTHTFSGSSTPTGVVSKFKQVVRSLSGSSTPTGALLRSDSRHFSGSSTPTGHVLRSDSRHLSGSSTPTGHLGRTAGRHFSGSSTPTGVLATIHAVLTTATAARIRAGVVTLARFISTTATGARTRLGLATTQTTDPAAAGTQLVRWRFDDPLTGNTYSFEVNPASASVDAKGNLTVQPTTAADGDPLIFQGDDDALIGEFEGVVLTRLQADTFRTWFELGRPIFLTDDLQQRMAVVLTKVTPVRHSTVQHVRRQRVTVSYRILERVA